MHSLDKFSGREGDPVPAAPEQASNIGPQLKQSFRRVLLKSQRGQGPLPDLKIYRGSQSRIALMASINVSFSCGVPTLIRKYSLNIG